MNTDTQTYNDWKKWLENNWPNVKALDHDWTMERYDYPQYVRNGIAENWIKVNDVNGGTWHEPEYHRLKCAEKSFAKSYEDSGLSDEDSGLSDEMDEINKNALKIMQNEGMEAAVNYMFTDQESGRQLSYGEMRMRYG